MRAARIPMLLLFSVLAGACATAGSEGSGEPPMGNAPPAGAAEEQEADGGAAGGSARPQAGAPDTAGEGGAADAGASAGPPGAAAMPHRCPMQVPDTEVTLEEGTGGPVSLRFSTDRPQSVAELQDRVEAVGDRLEREGVARLAEVHASGDPGRPAGWAAAGRAATQDQLEPGEAPDGPSEGKPYAATQGDVEGADEEDDRRLGQENLAKHEALMAPQEAPATGPVPVLRVTTRVEDTADGARLTLTPADASDGSALAEEMRWRVSMMNSGQCPMAHANGGHSGMHMHGHGEGHTCTGDCPHHEAQ